MVRLTLALGGIINACLIVVFRSDFVDFVSGRYILQLRFYKLNIFGK